MRLFFVRNDFGGVENIMVVDIEFDTYVMDALGAYNAIKTACTKWANETAEGKTTWEATSEDFNVGDLACYITPTLLEYLLLEGISDIHFEQMDNDHYFPFDQLLISKS